MLTAALVQGSQAAQQALLLMRETDGHVAVSAMAIELIQLRHRRPVLVETTSGAEKEGTRTSMGCLAAANGTRETLAVTDEETRDPTEHLHLCPYAPAAVHSVLKVAVGKRLDGRLLTVGLLGCRPRGVLLSLAQVYRRPPMQPASLV